MVLNATKSKLADMATTRGIDIPQGFMDSLDPATDVQDLQLSPLEDTVATLKALPDFDLVEVIRMLVAQEEDMSILPED